MQIAKRGTRSDRQTGAGSGDDFIAGGAGSDTLKGGEGNDTILSQSGMTVDHRSQPDDSDAAHVPAGASVLAQGPGWSVYRPAGGSNITITGGTFDTSTDGDTIDAGEGDDIAVGSHGDDVVLAGTGDDLVWGAGGADSSVDREKIVLIANYSIPTREKCINSSVKANALRNAIELKSRKCQGRVVKLSAERSTRCRRAHVPSSTKSGCVKRRACHA